MNINDYVLKNINEEEDKSKEYVEKSDICFDIWQEVGVRTNWLKDNFSYNKIEYKFIDKKKGIEIDFLLGYRNGTWHLWIGKIGIINYELQPYVDLCTPIFSRAIILSLDKIQDFVKQVYTDKDNWVDYYINR